jgi:hypothetical protein
VTESTVFAVEHIANGAAAQSVDFGLDSAVDRVGAGAQGFGFGRLGLTARRAAIGEAGLAGPKLKFFSANDTGFDWEGHT